MRIVTDSGTDVSLSPKEMARLDIHVVPLTVTLEGTSYREGVDIQPDAFYRLLAATDSLPLTSQPSAGEFAEIYRRLAETDPDILSVHMSSGLSGCHGRSRKPYCPMRRSVRLGTVAHEPTKEFSKTALSFESLSRFGVWIHLLPR